MSDVKHFTLVFEGELNVLPTNPHKMKTPFGFPVACGVGDAFAKIDALEGTHDWLAGALMAMLKLHETHHNHPVHASARAALSAAQAQEDGK